MKKRDRIIVLCLIFAFGFLVQNLSAQQPGEITPEEFIAIVKKLPKDVVLLDVRTKEEAEKGRLKGAINIPKEELEQRAGELPKDKRIIIYCSHGFRAEWAWGLLVNYLGFKDVKFLNRQIRVNPDGSFKILKSASREE